MNIRALLIWDLINRAGEISEIHCLFAAMPLFGSLPDARRPRLNHRNILFTQRVPRTVVQTG